jgi:hypothetical protein
MRRPYRSSTNSSNLTECVFYIRVVYFAYHRQVPNAQGRGVGVFITHLRAKPRIMFERGGIVKLLGTDAFQDDIGTAMGRLTREARR